VIPSIISSDLSPSPSSNGAHCVIMLSTGIGGSYVPKAVEVFQDEMTEDKSTVAYEHISRPFAPAKPPPPTAPPPSDAAFKSRGQSALSRLGKTSRAPWIETVVKTILNKDSTADDAYADDIATHESATGAAIVGCGVVDVLIPGGDSEEDSDEEYRVYAAPVVKPGPASRHFVDNLSSDEDDDGAFMGRDKDEAKRSSKPEEKAAAVTPFAVLTRFDPSQFDAAALLEDLGSLDPAAEAAKALEELEGASRAAAAKASDLASDAAARAKARAMGGPELAAPAALGGAMPRRKSRAEAEADFVSRMVASEAPLGFGHLTPLQKAALAAEGAQAEAAAAQAEAAAKRKAKDDADAAATPTVAEVFERGTVVGQVKGLFAGVWERVAGKDGGGKLSKAERLELRRQARAAEKAAAEKAAKARRDLEDLRLFAGKKKETTPEERERARLARMARLGMVRPEVVELGATSSESSDDDDEAPAYFVGMRVEVDRGKGKGWELGTVVKLAEVTDEDRAAETANREAQVARAAADAARAAAEAAQAVAAGLGLAPDGGDGGGDSGKARAAAAEEAARADRALRAAARREREAERAAANRRRRRRRRARPLVQLDGWRTCFAYQQTRPLPVATAHLQKGESEGRVAEWSPPLQVVMVPDYPGTAAGYTVYTDQTFVYLRTVTIRHKVPGFGGREFSITFYELANMTGWVHDFCEQRPNGKAILTGGSANSARDASVGGMLEGWAGDLMAAVTGDDAKAKAAKAAARAEADAKARAKAERRRKRDREAGMSEREWKVPDADDDPVALAAKKASAAAARGGGHRKKRSPDYLERLKGLKAAYGEEQYKALVWWHDKGTAEADEAEAALDAAAERQVAADNAARWTALADLTGSPAGSGPGFGPGASGSLTPWFGGNDAERAAAAEAAAAAKVAAAVAEAARPRCHFGEHVRLVHIPSWRIMRPSVRSALWCTSAELKVAKKRSIVEFEFEEWDWEKVLGDEHMVPHGGERIHPVHLYNERMQQQSVAELRLLADEANEVQQLRRLVQELILYPAAANETKVARRAATGGIDGGDRSDEEERGGGDGGGDGDDGGQSARSGGLKGVDVTEMPLGYWQGRYASRGSKAQLAADPFDRTRMDVARAASRAATSGGAAAGRLRRQQQRSRYQDGDSDGGDGVDGEKKKKGGDDDSDSSGSDDEAKAADDSTMDAPEESDEDDDALVLGSGGPDVRRRKKAAVRFDEDEDFDEDLPDGDEGDAVLEARKLNGDVSTVHAVERQLAARRRRRAEAAAVADVAAAARAARRARRDEASAVRGLPLRRGLRELHEAEVERRLQVGAAADGGSEAASRAAADVARANASRRGGQFGFGAGASSPSGFVAELGGKELDLVVRGGRDEGANVKASKLYDDVQRMRRKQKKERLGIMKELSTLRSIVGALAAKEPSAEHEGARGASRAKLTELE